MFKTLFKSLWFVPLLFLLVGGGITLWILLSCSKENAACLISLIVVPVISVALSLGSFLGLFCFRKTQRKLLSFLIGIISPLFIFFLIVYSFSASQFRREATNNQSAQTENEIYEAINRSNYCSFDSDCRRAVSQCPFGCNIFVNVNEIKNINELMTSYESTCNVPCKRFNNAECIDNRCTPIRK